MKTAIVDAQIRAARSLLGWTREILSDKSGIPPRRLAYLETGGGRPREEELTAVRRVLEAAGVEFTSGDTPGVRLRTAQADDVDSGRSRREVGPEDEERGQQAGDLPFNQRDD